MRARRRARSQAVGDRIREAQDLVAQVGPVVDIHGERLLVADRLGLGIGGHRTVIDASGEVPEMATVAVAHRGDHRVDGQPGQRAHGLDADRDEARPGRRPHAPQGVDGKGVEEGLHLVRSDDPDSETAHGTSARRLGLRSLRRQLGEELVGGDTDRAAQAAGVANPLSEEARDLLAGSQGSEATAHVQEGLVQRQRLDERRDVTEGVHHHS